MAARISLVLVVLTAVVAAADGSASSSAPTLGRQWAHAQAGYGRIKPAKISNGGDPTGLLWRVHWNGWGSRRAVGRGVGYFLWPGLGVADGTIAARAEVVAYDLGPCRGRLAYRKIEWHFPPYGGTFIPENFIDICTGEFGPGPVTRPCGRVGVRSPAGVARKISASGLTCRRARELVERTPAARYLDRGGRFRYAGLFCGSEGRRVVGTPAMFECARGRIDVLFELTRLAARKPTSTERAAIAQAIFDYYLHTHVSPAHAVIRKIRISTHAPFARVDLWDPTASGPGSALLGYRRGTLGGWRVLDIGSAAVGCLPARVFGGHKAAVLRDLRLACP